MYVAAIGRVEEIIWLPYDAGLSTAAETLVRILKRVVVSPAVYPRFLEIAELARSLCHSWATCQQYYDTYFRLFTLSQKKTNCYPVPTTPENVTALPCKMHTFFIWLNVCCIPLNVGGLKRTRCDVWQMECQASNVTAANVQSSHLLHGYMLPVLFATDQLHRPPPSAEIQPMSQQNASSTRPYRGLVLDIRMKK